MSLQRVLETARKTGLPVIVTDVAGREPMVILPLEQYEALTDSEETVAPSLPKVAQPRQEIKTVPLPIDADEGVNVLSESKESTSVRLEAVAEQSLEDEEEIPLEERFYLEPVEDK